MKKVSTELNLDPKKIIQIEEERLAMSNTFNNQKGNGIVVNQSVPNSERILYEKLLDEKQKLLETMQKLLDEKDRHILRLLEEIEMIKAR